MSKTYRYQLDRDVVLPCNTLRDYTFSNDWLVIENSSITIAVGYAWDGVSPRFNFFDLFTIGPPEGRLDKGKPITYYPSLVHDALLQFKSEIHIGNNTTTKAFDEQLKRVEFKLRRLYVAVVRAVM
jgi:hypothetical protein